MAIKSLFDILQVEYPAHGCVSLAPAWKWDFGTVVGNGSQGALAFCRTSSEELVLSQEEMFLPLFPFTGYLPVKAHYKAVQELVLAGKSRDAEALLRRIKGEARVAGYNTTDPFVGSCSLDLLMREACGYDAYIRSIDFASGEGLTAWRDPTGLYHRRFFVSRLHDVLVVKLSGLDGAKLNLDIRLREIAYTPPTDPKDQDIYKITIDRCEGTVSERALTHRMYFKKRLAEQHVNGCCTAAKVSARGGSILVGADRLSIEGADELVLLVRTVPDRQGEELSEAKIVESIAGIVPDYDALLAAHTAIHGAMFGRCRLSLSSQEEQAVVGEEMQAGSRVGATSPALVEKVFEGARYGIIASTGRMPPALQGVWTGTWKPRWSGDYTTNGNVQSMVAASLCSNHYECLESLMDYLDSLMDDFRDNARELLGFRGPLITWRSSTHGRTHYLAYRRYHHDFPGIYWFAGAAWFAQHYFDYYLYTGNEEFFETRLRPFLLDCAALYEDYLTLEQDGVYVLAPSSSPENQLEDEAWIAPNATMTIAAIKQLLRSLLWLGDKLGVEASRFAKWREMLSKMPSYQVGVTGALKEWAWPGIENREEHRHASHLYPLWFGVDPEIAASDKLKEACRLAIDHRMAFRRPDNGGFMAFGFTQLGIAAAYLGDTALAYESVEYLVNSYWSPVMVSQHNSGETPDVLNLDISGGLPALVITMLVQSLMPGSRESPWIISLLPCLPSAWRKGSLAGIKCRGGFEVDICWDNGKLSQVCIKSSIAGALMVVYGSRSVTFDFGIGEELLLDEDLKAVDR